MITDEQIRALRNEPTGACIGHRDDCGCATCTDARWHRNALVQLLDRAEAGETAARDHLAEIIKRKEAQLTTLHFTTLVSMAVACAINFDDTSLRTQLCGAAVVKRLKNGYRVTGTREELALLADGMDRHDGFDLAPSTIAACNNAARKIRELLQS